MSTETHPDYRSPLLDRPGAVPADPPDTGVAAHYGDPYAEQRRLAAGHGAVDLSHRPVVRISGPDRLTWLHTLTSQHVAELAPGVATTALLLSPHGHIEHALHLVDDGAATWMHVEPGSVEALLEHFVRMRFWSKVEIEDVTTSTAVVWEPATGPHATLVTLADPPPVPGGTDGVTGRHLLVPRDGLSAHVTEPAGSWAYEALRIVAGRPRVGLETDHRTIPHELDWLRDAVHLSKGCYRGQETVARVHNLGRPPRRLVRLHLDGSVDHLPPHGSAVLLGSRTVGIVTSSARHHELGPVALALVKRSTDPEAALTADGVSAAQEVIVPA